jgi:hypothetical protein
MRLLRNVTASAADGKERSTYSCSPGHRNGVATTAGDRVAASVADGVAVGADDRGTGVGSQAATASASATQTTASLRPTNTPPLSLTEA